LIVKLKIFIYLYSMKKCIICKEEKELILFSKDNYRKDKLSIKCKVCAKQKSIEYYNKNKSEIYKKRREYTKKYNAIHGQEYRDKNKEKARLVGRAYYKKNKAKMNKRSTELTLAKRRTKIEYKIAHNLRSRVALAIKNGYKKTKTIELLGCDIIFFKHHISSQFKDGMSWDNYGKHTWHIDHIKPCVSFDLTKEEEQRKCFHYTNLQPLSAFDNLSKGGKY